MIVSTSHRVCTIKNIDFTDFFNVFLSGATIGAEWLFQGNMDWITLMAIFLFFFLAWTCVIATGFLAVIVSRTVLINSRFAGIVSFILFFVINGIVEYIYNLFAKYGLMGIHSGLYIGIGECAFYIVACIILFVISSVLAEKKLSV